MRSLVLALIAFALGGCDLATAPDLYWPNGPGGSEALKPVPMIYWQWWEEVEQESGLPGDMGSVAWYQVKGGSWWHEKLGHITLGMYRSADRSIFIADNRIWNKCLIKHEMLHAKIGGRADPEHLHPLFAVYDACMD